jgi:hypothetical protein
LKDNTIKENNVKELKRVIQATAIVVEIRPFIFSWLASKFLKDKNIRLLFSILGISFIAIKS